MEKITGVLNGKKTYTGVIVTMFGALGLTQYITGVELSVVLDALFQIGGLVLTIIGALHKDAKIAEVKEELGDRY